MQDSTTDRVLNIESKERDIEHIDQNILNGTFSDRNVYSKQEDLRLNLEKMEQDGSLSNLMGSFMPSSGARD